MISKTKSLNPSSNETLKYSRRQAIALMVLFLILIAIWQLLTPEYLKNIINPENLPNYLGSFREWLMITTAVFFFYFFMRKDKKVIKLLEDKLNDSAEKLEFILDVNEDGLWELDQDAESLLISNRFKDIAKIESSDRVFTIDSFILSVAEQDREELKNNFLQLRDGNKQEFNFEFRLNEQNNNSISWIKCYGKKYDSKMGSRQHRLIGFIKDISEHKAAKLEQQKLLHQREILLKRLRLQIDKMPIGYILTDKNFNIQFINPAAQHIFNYSIDELKDKQPYGYIFDKNQQEFFEDTRREIIEHGDTSVIVLENRRKEGTKIYCEWFNTPLWSENGEFNLLSMVVDITTRVKAELELKTARDKAEQSSKMKSIFLAQMSHEIRTPVSTILNYTSMLREYLQNLSEDNFTEIFHSIDNGARRLIRTIDLILNMSELQTGYYETEKVLVDFELDIIEPLVADFSSAASLKGLDIFIENIAGNVKFFTDSYISTQIISNLVDNAIKYTQKGFVRIGILKDEQDMLCVEVEDTGIGISQEYLDKLFTPFSQEEMGYSRSFDGNGLGLALVKKYCDLINSEIRVKSKKGVGSTFQIIFKDSVRENHSRN